MKGSRTSPTGGGPAPAPAPAFAALYPANHPYHHLPIGDPAELRQAKLEDVRAFFRTYYVPNNATLTLVGDIDIAKTKALVEKYFGPLVLGVGPPRVTSFSRSPRRAAPPAPALVFRSRRAAPRRQKTRIDGGTRRRGPRRLLTKCTGPRRSLPTTRRRRSAPSRKFRRHISPTARVSSSSSATGFRSQSSKSSSGAVPQKYLPTAKLPIVIVGDAAAIRPSLEALNLGPIEVR